MYSVCFLAICLCHTIFASSEFHTITLGGKLNRALAAGAINYGCTPSSPHSVPAQYCASSLLSGSGPCRVQCLAELEHRTAVIAKFMLLSLFLVVSPSFSGAPCVLFLTSHLLKKVVVKKSPHCHLGFSLLLSFSPLLTVSSFSVT